MNTTEKNKLIAEFMGFNVLSKEEYLKHPQHETLNVTKYAIIEYQRYHNSWDWLIPVVEKIESLNFEVQIYKNTCIIYKLGNTLTIGKDSETKIAAAYNAVIEFIKWYNKQK